MRALEITSSSPIGPAQVHTPQSLLKLNLARINSRQPSSFKRYHKAMPWVNVLAVAHLINLPTRRMPSCLFSALEDAILSTKYQILQRTRSKHGLLSYELAWLI